MNKFRHILPLGTKSFYGAMVSLGQVFQRCTLGALTASLGRFTHRLDQLLGLGVVWLGVRVDGGGGVVVCPPWPDEETPSYLLYTHMRRPTRSPTIDPIPHQYL